MSSNSRCGKRDDSMLGALSTYQEDFILVRHSWKVYIQLNYFDSILQYKYETSGFIEM